jgi:hypothetical protein
MKCEWVRENVILYVYDELADDARFELEQHIARCRDCANELRNARGFVHNTMAAMPVEEPSPNLLTGSRMRLQEALETAEQGGFWSRWVIDPMAWLRQMRFSPALAAAIFIVGFGGGIAATYQLMNSRSGGGQVISQLVSAQPAAEANISGIQSITQDPGSDKISIKYNTVSTREAEGNLNDENIQRLLLFAARNNYNSGVRMDSVDLLTQKPSDGQVREVLIYALRYDTNPGVRLKAIEGLGPFVKDDVRVRDSVLTALMNDSNPGVRTQALHLLEPVRADSSVRAVLQHLAEHDQNQYIRSQARVMLAQLPEID